MMILTPEQLIKQYFPEPIETTRELYKQLEFDELSYSYLDWLQDAEKHCLSKFANEIDYKLLPDGEKNYWINQKVFWTLIQSSPSKKCDQIRAGLMDIANRVATDRDYARKLGDQLDQEYGIKKVIPKVSRKLKVKYNDTGQDAFEFSVQPDTRLYMDIISGYHFQPGQKIKDAYFSFKLTEENGVPFHIIEINLSLNNNHTFSYRTIWCCSEERPRYRAILENRVIRVNLFEDNKKLVDSFDYILSPTNLNALTNDLEKAIGMLLEINLDNIDLEQLGQKILHRHNLNDQAYALAIKEVISKMAEYREEGNSEIIENAFLNAVDQYWDYYVLRPDPTKDDNVDDLDQMVKDRIPRVTLAMIVTNMINYSDLCESYFKRKYSKKEQTLLNAGNLRLISALALTEFDPTVAVDKRLAEMCTFITGHWDLMKEILIEMGEW